MALALTLSLLIAIIAFTYLPRSLSTLSSQSNRHCDQDYCDSLVQKCTLTQRCTCSDFKENRYCAKDCIDCLEEKFGKCCGCLDGLCDLPQDDVHSSHVGDLNKTSDDMFFQVLTEEDDIHGRWSVDRYLDRLLLNHPEQGQFELAHRVVGPNSTMISHDTDLDKRNCTVAFINRHLSMAKCKRSCITMGASFFRWFQDGCCECVGKHCFYYGVNKPKCSIKYD